MTEQEWLACTDPQKMLEFLRGKASDRKLLLITTACCRRAWWCCLTSRRCTQALKRAERDADNSSLSEKELRRANSKLSAIAASSGYFNIDEGRAIVIRLGRDIVGNPFRPIPIEPAWVTVTVTNLAATAYEERAMPRGELDLARISILADALEEAGCDNADILSHLRGPGPHVRGCWAVDLLLGRE
jgi:hypothetical protein